MHGAQCSAALPHTVFITTRQGPFIGPDRGSEWIPVNFGNFSEITYTRDLKPHPTTLTCCMSPLERQPGANKVLCTVVGTCSGRLNRSTGASTPTLHDDGGRRPQSTGPFFCNSRDGQVFGSWATEQHGTPTTYRPKPGK
ncbi:MAG: hypothetical protein Ct9H300mP11_25170 [Chloroflexota bacterium]|nr:MAG: hypothetical protein Ct9H300mP11_25170 [Chloroflexota bacterium]